MRAGGDEEAQPAFDPASLPPIESIGAGTDIAVFLKPGVPADLARAALRRAWVADPAIRDFVGLAENAWDFTAPGGVPGFEPLRAIDDVQRLAAQLMGTTPPADPEVPSPVASSKPGERKEDAAQADPVAQPSLPASDLTAPQGASDVAMQKDVTLGQGDVTTARPRHGGALAQ